MQAQCPQHEECQYIKVWYTPPHVPDHSPDVAAVLDDDFSFDSSPHVEMLESEGGILPTHPNVIDDSAHDWDSVDENVVDSDPDPSPSVERLVQSSL